jgi:diguanylate cyclase (GGDEF)-like protein
VGAIVDQRRWRRVYLASAVVLAVAYVASPGGGGWDLLFTVTVLISAAACHRAARVPGWGRASWLLLALSCDAVVVGDLTRIVHDHFVGPSAAAWLVVPYLAGYPLAASGIALRAVWYGVDRGIVVDTVIIAIATSGGLWVSVASRLMATDADPTAVLMSSMQPAFSVLTLGAVVLTVLASRLRDSTSRLVAGAAVCVLIGTALQARSGDQGWNDVMSTFYLASYVLLGAASFRPAARRSQAPTHDLAVSRARLAVLAGSAVWGTVDVALQPTQRWSVLVLSVGLILLVCARIAEPVWNLAHTSLHDPLTGLPNRTQLLRRLSFAMERMAVGDGDRLAVLFCDLDRFKVVNDTLGHEAGDELLVALAHRLRHVAGPRDLVARLGGDEFVVVSTELRGDDAAHALADRVAAAVRAPLTLSCGVELAPSASVGVRISTDPHAEPADLIRDADTAMYRAKANGGGTTRSHRSRAGAALLTPSETSLRSGPALVTDLRQAITRGGLVHRYEPVTDQGGLLRAVRISAGWHVTPDGGTASATRLSTLADGLGLHLELLADVLTTACSDRQRWLGTLPEHHAPLLVVPLTTRQLADPRTTGAVYTVLREHRTPPEAVSVEVHGTVPAATSDVLTDLRRLGITVGTPNWPAGSSIAALTAHRWDYVCLPSTLLGQPATAQPTMRLVSALIDLAHATGAQVIATGIAEPTALAELRASEADLFSGPAIGPPLEAHKILARTGLATHR